MPMVDIWEARAGLTEFSMPKELKNKLLDFQEKAVFIAAHHLNKRGGVIIGDVVGLGKTLIGTALAKILEEDFFLEILIICPKNLKNMWEDYVYTYRLHAKVISITEVQSVLQELRRFRVVLIDESHNLRNREGKRYRAIQEYIQQNESKVIMLSATPYNKRYTDLSNQLRLFLTEEDDLGVSPERYLEEIGGRVQFLSQYQYSERSILAFEKSTYADDWRELMRLFLIRRTRSFIKNNYAEVEPQTKKKYLKFSDGQKSYFPDRIAKKVEFKFDLKNKKDQYAVLYSEEVVDIINQLNLPRYGLANYLHPTPKVKPSPDEDIIKENLSRAGRALMGFCRTNLFKRLESSGYSFLLSISRHILRNFIYIYAIDKKKQLPIGVQEMSFFDDFLEDNDIDNYNDKIEFLTDENKYFNKAGEIYNLYYNEHYRQFDWINSELFLEKLKKDLIEDARNLIEIIKKIGNWNKDKDRKLTALLELISKTHKNDKIIIFSQYFDTVYYIYDFLNKHNIKDIEWVTGDSENPTLLAYRFSPKSNNKEDEITKENELRILISTDVLSEGQNLQDAYIVVNYDLPWAIIRLIQRAGRVDRIGQTSDKIICYSFLPEEGVENIIGLRNRLTNRIRENAEVVGADEIFFEGDPVNIRDLYNEKAGILDEDEEEEVDLSSYAFQIWKNAIDKNSVLKKIIPEMPNVVYGTKSIDNTQEEQEGVIVYARTSENNDILSWVDNNGNLITQSQLRILKKAKCEPDEKPHQKIKNHHELVKSGIKHISQIESQIGGQLGKKSGARYRTYMRLDRYYNENKDTLFVNENLKRTIETIYKFPLRESAREILNRQLKAGISDSELADLVVSLAEEDKLCLIDLKEDSDKPKEPQIICSLGMVKE